MFLFAEALRLDAFNPKTIIRLHGLVTHHLGDLLHIPPYVAPRKDPIIAEVTVTNRETGKTHEVELTADV